ncbi:MAG: DUF721 domain-containing protein [Candidatus Fermentithermobacillus carboniphilus]|uniref:DUF721 domain-containing protein n=1 Tax=Candidatus Fermentithermobacillus carboniphilus TaxID=3085328 RepID=A0AAT9L9X2_9FIRM|nr:MAG: DUF721 domain-containing protein [Candidatus Fermentithermobacillus carboniphilus]
MTGSAIGPEMLSDILERTLAGLGLLPKARRYQVFSLWRRIVGDVARNARPRKIEGDVLYVATSTSAWAYELTLMRRRIIRAVNEALGGEYIKDIRFSEHLWNRTGTTDFRFEDGSFDRDKPEPPSMSAKDLLSGGHCEGKVEETFFPEIPDPRVSAAFKKYRLTMRMRKQRLVERGFSVCPACGYVYPSRYRECPSCKSERESRSYLVALSFLEKHPYMSDLAASVSTGIKDLSIFERARQEIDSRWLRTVRHCLSAVKTNGEIDPGTGELLEKLVSLRTCRRLEELTETEIDRVLGKRLAMSLKDRALLRARIRK